MKYLMNVYYTTELMKKVTAGMQQVMRNNTRLQGCRTLEFETDKPLTKEQIVELEAIREDWVDEVKVERVK